MGGRPRDPWDRRGNFARPRAKKSTRPRPVFGWSLFVAGCCLAIGSVFLTIDVADEAEDLATVVETGILTFVLCLLPAAYGFRIARGSDEDEPRSDDKR
jgi:hypothetical protein